MRTVLRQHEQLVQLSLMNSNRLARDVLGMKFAWSVSMLAYEKLDVYQCAIEFLALSAKILDSLPKGNSALGDQLRRAALSIPLNIAEGAGKPTMADRKRFSGIARGSAMECGAILDVCRVLAVADDSVLVDGKRLLVRMVSMLTKMCR
jgi:four helix bundle protein